MADVTRSISGAGELWDDFDWDAFFWDAPNISTAAGALGSERTVALTGVAVTVSAGSLDNATSVALTGERVICGAGLIGVLTQIDSQQ
ncbi:MAG TPA: hypothetical protein VFB99_10750, partial [Vicinamibacterales bacterium]|nr:hypothetical protein [Vicinamibacterales bacterium]